MTNLSVLAFCDYYEPDAIGGAERVAHEIYRRLAAESGWSVSVVGCVASTSPGMTSRAPRSFETDGVRVTSVPGRALSRVLHAQMMVGPSLRRTAVREARRLRPDVVHINGLHFHSSQVGIGVAHKLGIPVVTTAHLGAVDDMPGRLRGASVLFDRIAGGRVIRRSDRVIAVSQAVADHVVTLGADPSKVVVARNGVDRDRFCASRRIERTPSLRVGLIGRLIANKGHSVALQALSLAREGGSDMTLRIVGEGPLAGAAREQVRRLGLEDAVTFTGQVSDVAEQLRSIDVLVRPSYTEGFPLAVLEALASGVPCIVSDVPGNVETVRDGVDGIVVGIGDVEGFASALRRLDTDRKMLETMSDEAARGAERFGWDDTAQVHRDAFCEVAGFTPQHASDSGGPRVEVPAGPNDVRDPV